MVEFPKIRKGGEKGPPPAPKPSRAPPSPDLELPPPPVPIKPADRPEPRIEDIKPLSEVAPSNKAASPAPEAEPAGPEPEERTALPEERHGPEETRKERPIKLPETGGREPSVGDLEGHGPSVFIKIDKYTDIIRNLQRLKSHAMSLRDALDALADIEKEIATGISLGHRALDEFNSIITLLDTKLNRAGPLEDIDASTPEEMERYIKGIHDQMERIKDELKDIS